MSEKKKTSKKEGSLTGEERKHLLKCRLIRLFKPVKRNKIVFSQFGGKGYGCNPRAICDEFLRRNGNYDLVWILGKSKSREEAGIPDGVRTVKGNKAIYELLTAKVWINNIHFNKNYSNGLVKRGKTIYLNTFHGGITLKSEGKDKHTYKPKAYEDLSEKEKNYRVDSKYVDYITCGGEVEKHVLNEFFYGHGNILELGDARTDILVNGSEASERAVRKWYGIGEDVGIVFFAPTFRNGMSLKWYDMDYVRVVEALEERTGKPWVMLIRLHPRLISKAKQLIPDSEKLINASDYPDMQDIAVAADMMISDYSSAITDFMLTGKPAFMYVPDLKEYMENRGMYYTMEQLPFPYAETTDALIEEIAGFDGAAYAAKSKEFLEFIGYKADGHAAERIVDFLIEKIR